MSRPSSECGIAGGPATGVDGVSAFGASFSTGGGAGCSFVGAVAAPPHEIANKANPSISTAITYQTVLLFTCLNLLLNYEL